MQSFVFTRPVTFTQALAAFHRFANCVVAIVLVTLAGAIGQAASFTLAANSNTARTLGAAAGETGTVNAGISLTISGGTVAVSITGNNATLTNLGTISQTGTGRVIRDNTGVTGLTINNGSISNSTALMQAADADVFQMNRSPASVTLNNYGTMKSLNKSAGGAQAVDFTAILSGSNTINNYGTGFMLADQADAVRPGVNGVVYNAGTIKATSSTGSSSDGVDVQNSNGVMITNDITGLIEGARHGITGGAPNSVVTFTTSVTNEAGGVIKGLDGSGINLDGFNANQSATIINHGTISGFGVTDDGDGVDVDGIVNLTNTGTIRSGNAFSSAAGVFALSEGISAGGGTITNSGTIEGLVAAGNATALGRGISLVGIDVPGGTREAIYANTTVNNNSGGLIRGSSDSGIAVGGPASGFTVTINNEANATIRGGGALAAAILAGADKDTINNAGLIDGSSSGLALSLGAGDDNLNVTGGDASILGDIDGGTGTNTMKVNPGAGKLFAYAGSIKNFNLVELTSGTMSLSGVSTYTGTTKISGGVLELDGANRLSQSSKLNLNGGTLALKNAGPLNGQSFACLSLSDDSTIDLGGTSLTFGCLESALTGKKLSVENYSNGNSPSFAFRLFGDVSGDSTFTALMKLTTVNGLRAVYRFDGTYTDVTAAPEPSTMALMALGALMIPLLRRRTR